MSVSRRSFLQGCCAGIIAMNGARVSGASFSKDATTSRDIIVSIFLRGGMDALSFIAPYNDTDYQTARPTIGLKSTHVLDLNGQFGIHKMCPELKEMYDNKRAAFIVATGSPDPTRSHFLAQDYMERGRPGDRSSGGGWLARHVASIPSASPFQAISRGSNVAVSLEGLSKAIAMTGADGFSINGNDTDDVRRALRRMYGSANPLSAVALNTLDAIDTMDVANPDDYVPEFGAVYANNSFHDALESVAQLIKMEVGLEAITIDYGGWDTHNGQANNDPSTGEFAGLVEQLSKGIAAFTKDMTNYENRITIVVMSEFGRRLRQNNNAGTDHGHGGTMMVVGPGITQKKIWGAWPGLANENLFENVDLAATTDYRQVLTEILIARLGNSNVATMFPGYTYPGPVGMYGTAGIFVPPGTGWTAM